MGYGSKALELVEKFFENRLVSIDEDVEVSEFENFDSHKDNYIND